MLATACGAPKLRAMLLLRIRQAPLACALALLTLGVGAGGSPASAQDAAPLLLAVCAGPLAGGATGHAGFAAELARLAEISGAAPQRSRALVRHSDTGAAAHACSDVEAYEARLTPEPALAHVVHNGGYASDRNNGAMWAGRGVSSTLRLGATATWQGFRLTLAPEFVYHANDAFTTRTGSDLRHELAHPLYGGIDWFQRPGRDADSRLTWGQSTLAFERWGVATGISTENAWIGPATRYPILLSNTAEGLTHAFLGTHGSPDIWIGRLDAQLMLGRTEESDWFDDDGTNDFSNLVAWSVSLRPRGLRWLEVGAARTFHYRTRRAYDLDLEPVFGFLTPSVTNRVGDELGSIFMRAVLPEHGMEFYGEWARTDRYGSIENDLLTEPDHSQGYTIGFQKLSPIGDGAFRLRGELVHLQERGEDRGGSGRVLNVFYTNGQLRQGHTHDGQLLGAWVGPGADAQYLEAGWLSPATGYLGVFGERVHRNQTRDVERRDIYPFTSDVELIGGARAGFVFGESLVDATVAYHYEINRLYFEEESSNLRFEVAVTGY